MNSEIQEILNKHAFEIHEFVNGSSLEILKDLNNDLHHYKFVRQPLYNKAWYGGCNSDWWLINFGVGIIPCIKTTVKKVKYYTFLGDRIDIFEEDKRVLFKIKM